MADDKKKTGKRGGPKTRLDFKQKMLISRNFASLRMRSIKAAGK